eukprot:TRINITY_DN5185_c0_g1_i1.p1 TRINITY_DN5185_c0_g1~~TRINITY_DN5185_c0_g1_i1.p1  ORF type:complete len:172 (+),score=33.64 TRINITY_DN5185_c0_g1_i1:482-997(+)
MCRSRILGAPHLTRPNSVLAQFLRHSFPEAHAQSAAEHTAREAQREADAALHGGTQEAQGGQTAPGDPQRIRLLAEDTDSRRSDPHIPPLLGFLMNAAVVLAVLLVLGCAMVAFVAVHVLFDQQLIVKSALTFTKALQSGNQTLLEGAMNELADDVLANLSQLQRMLGVDL